jgi:hypothetical protein
MPASTPPTPAVRHLPAPTSAAPAARLPAPAKPPLPRLPTAEEARENPDLVISLDATPPVRPQAHTPGRPADSRPGVPASDATVDAPPASPPLDLPALPHSGIALDRDEAPTDLPPPGSGPRFALPEGTASEPAAASARSARRSPRSLGERLLADPKSIIQLLAWAAPTYLRKPAPFVLLAAAVVLPVSFFQSCLGTALLPRTPTIVVPAVAPDFSARKSELVKRIQESRASGKFDSEAAVALAELTAEESAQVLPPKVGASESPGWLRLRLILLVQGLLVLGLAMPVACGVLAIALFDRESGAALPALADVWPMLVARAGLFALALLPAALLVAVGYALYVVPGVVLSVLVLFVPHVVIFEKRVGRDALLRSVELVKRDAIRCVLALLTFVLASAVVTLLTEQLLPISASRAAAFVHFLVRDLLIVVLLPIPALVLARLYLDQRGKSAESLSRAARS